MRAIVDLETDGFEATRIWCICAVDIDTQEEYKFGPTELDKFLELSKKITLYVGHHFLTFDRKWLKKLLGLDIPVEKVEDTLILSRLCFTGIHYQHSIEAWGERLGHPKQIHEDWSRYTPEMLERCISDCRINYKLYKTILLPELKNFSRKCVELEHQVQEILNEQRDNGFYLDIDMAYSVYAKCKAEADAIESEIQLHFPPREVLVEKYTPRYTKEGTLFTSSARKIARFYRATRTRGGEYLCYELEKFNLGSPKQVTERLDEAGWKPVIKTDSGQGKLCQENFDTLPDTAPTSAKKLLLWLELNNRCKVLKGWFDAYNPATRSIHGTVIGIGASTHRMAHNSPQMANIPAVRSLYGSVMRACLGVEDKENWRLVGTDISGIQLCILAHYLNDSAYTDAIANGRKEDGTDVHSVNMRILQEVAPRTDRDITKTFIYAMLLGAGGWKLGQILGMDAAAGFRAKDLLFNRIPAFKRVQKMCQVAAARGYMVGIDGRRVPIKSEHFALSVYLQCGEAVIMKQALVYIKERAKPLTWFQCACVHDEIQSRVLKEQAEELGKLQVQAIVDAGLLFELRCPLGGEYKVGLNWKDTH